MTRSVKSLRSIILFLISLYIPAIFLVAGIIFLNPILGLFLGLGLVSILILFADKVLLRFFQIRKNNLPPWAENFIKNLSFKLNISKYYILATSGKNIFAIDGILATPRIIIAEDFFNFFSREECKALIYVTFLRIKNKESKFRTITCLLMDIFFFVPLKFPSQNIKISFLSLRYFLKCYLFKDKKYLNSFDKSLGNYRIPFASALFKLNIKNENENLFQESLGISENKSDMIIKYFFDAGYDFQERYSDLLRENGKA